MEGNRLIIAIISIMFIANFALYFVVKIDGDALILSVAVSLAEAIALVSVVGYWMNHAGSKHLSTFHHLP